MIVPMTPQGKVAPVQSHPQLLWLRQLTYAQRNDPAEINHVFLTASLEIRLLIYQEKFQYAGQMTSMSPGAPPSAANAPACGLIIATRTIRGTAASPGAHSYRFLECFRG